MRTLILGLLLGSCSLLVRNVGVERCDFEGILCSDDLREQIECVDGVELRADCGVGLSCIEGGGCTCGDDDIDDGEECDGANLPATDCTDLAGSTFDRGLLDCNDDCTLNTADCSECGNGVADGDERCDNPADDDCDPATCEFEFDSCNNSGAAAGTEICDGTDLRLKRCEDFGFEGGALQCVFDSDNGECGFNSNNCDRFPPQ